jgi:hypothetical protein
MLWNMLLNMLWDIWPADGCFLVALWLLSGAFMRAFWLGIFCRICCGICCWIVGQLLVAFWLLSGCFMVYLWLFAVCCGCCAPTTALCCGICHGICCGICCGIFGLLLVASGRFLIGYIGCMSWNWLVASPRTQRVDIE